MSVPTDVTIAMNKHVEAMQAIAKWMEAVNGTLIEIYKTLGEIETSVKLSRAPVVRP